MTTYSQISIQLDDGRTVVATPRPEDQEFLESYRDRDVALAARDDDDTLGHGIAATGDLTVDVEGHAITLRMPTPADAQAVRRALAVGLVSATVVAAGAIAALQGSQASPAAPEVVAPPAAIERSVVAPQPGADFLERRDRAIDPLLTEQAPLPGSQAGSSSGTAPADVGNPGTHGAGRGELERP